MTFEDFRKDWLSGDEYITAHTSGSTGIPKEIMLDKKFVAASARTTNSFFSLSVGSRFHSCVGADFIGGKMMLVRALVSGGVFTYEVPSNQPLSDVDASERIDLLAVVPSQMHHLLSPDVSLPEIGAIIIGGSAIPSNLRKKIAGSGLNCYETYGMTETASHIALRRVDFETAKPFHVIGEARVSRDERECLVIKYPDGQTIVTNDIAEILSPESFRILGRADDVIVTGGKKLNPIEVEQELNRISGLDCIVSSLPDEKWGEMAVALVKSECDRQSLSNVMNLFSLPRWMSPKKILVYETIPFTANRKINRCLLKKALKDMV